MATHDEGVGGPAGPKVRADTAPPSVGLKARIPARSAKTPKTLTARAPAGAAAATTPRVSIPVRVGRDGVGPVHQGRRTARAQGNAKDQAITAPQVAATLGVGPRAACPPMP